MLLVLLVIIRHTTVRIKGQLFTVLDISKLEICMIRDSLFTVVLFFCVCVCVRWVSQIVLKCSVTTFRLRGSAGFISF